MLGNSLQCTGQWSKMTMVPRLRNPVWLTGLNLWNSVGGRFKESEEVRLFLVVWVFSTRWRDALHLPSSQCFSWDCVQQDVGWAGQRAWRPAGFGAGNYLVRARPLTWKPGTNGETMGLEHQIPVGHTPFGKTQPRGLGVRSYIHSISCFPCMQNHPPAQGMFPQNELSSSPPKVLAFSVHCTWDIFFPKSSHCLFPPQHTRFCLTVKKTWLILK